MQLFRTGVADRLSTTGALVRQAPRTCRRGRRVGLHCVASQHHREEDHTTLRAHRGWLQRQRVLRHHARPGADDVLELNVAGRLLVTQRSTLMQVHGSRLRHMFDPLRDGLLPRDSKGVIFLDYDPDVFVALLKYLRELRAAGGTAAAVALPDLSPTGMSVLRYLLDTPTMSRSSPASLSNITSSRLAASSSGPAPVSRQAPRPPVQRHLKRPQAPPGSPAAAAAGQAVPTPSTASAKPATALLTAWDSSCAAGRDDSFNRLLYIRTNPNTTATGSPAAAAGTGGGGGRQGLKVSVLTESDLAAIPGQPAYSMVCDFTRTPEQLSFSFSLRNTNGFDNMYIGATTTSQVHQRGLQIPSFGWKQHGSSAKAGNWSAPTNQQQGHSSKARPPAPPATAAGATGGAASKQQDEDRHDRWRQQLAQWAQEQQQAAQALQSSAAGCTSPQGASSSSVQGAMSATPPPAAHAVGAAPGQEGRPVPLWRVGDHVELTIELGGLHAVKLRVNGRPVDTLRGLPSCSDWCCYMALFSGMEAACLIFERDSYSVCGGDYKLVRYLE